LRLLTPDGFAIAPLWLQLVIIFIASAILVFAFTPLVGSLSYCYTLFADPGTYGSADGFNQIFFGFFVLILGLILVSLIISVLTTALEELIENIRGGTRPYRKKGHILIIHRNAKLPLILDEMNLKYAGLEQVLDVVILLGDAEQVEEFWSGHDASHWPFLNIYLRVGDLLSYESYERVSIRSALGILLLLDETADTAYVADSQNLKTLAMLVKEETLWAHLERRHLEKRPVKCAMELSHSIKSHEIAHSLAALGPESLFHVMTPSDVAATVLSQAILDFAYYKIYLGLFSFENRSIYFVNPQRFEARGLRRGLKFEELCAHFTQGVLIGYSCATPAGMDIVLAPLGQPLQTGDWLLLIAPNEAAITYAAALPPHAAEAHSVRIPPTAHQCRVCLVGDERQFGRLGDFLNDASRQWYRENQIVLERPEEYFDDAFVHRLHEGGFDRIILNLEDELAFRFLLYLRRLFGADKPFLEKIITVLDDPLTEILLNQRDTHRNIILSDRLAAKYITQLVFQKTLGKVYLDLASRDSTEIKLLEVGVHLPRAALTSKDHVKHLLLAHGLIYLGAVNAQQECHFDTEDFADTRQIVAICPRTKA
jgi:hypothetical protein